MAHTDPIEVAALDALMMRIRDQWASAPDEWMLATRDPARLRFGYTFQVWLLSKAGVEEGAEGHLDALQIAKPSGRWHHELWALDSVAGSALSRRGPDGAIELERLYYAVPGAPAIAPAIAKLKDTELEGDPLLRLLYAPAWEVYALWIIEKYRSLALCAYTPPWCGIGGAEVVESQAFLQDLAKQDAIPGRDLDSFP